MKTVDLLTIGDCSIDLFMQLDGNFVAQSTETRISFLHGSKVPVESFETSIAGNACNVAIACTRLGMKCAIYTELGDDANADRIITELTNAKIDTSCCIRNEGTPTNVHAIIVHEGERTIFSYHEKRNYKIYNWPIPKWVFYSSLAKGFDDFQKKLVQYLKLNPRIGIAFNPGTQQLREGVKALEEMLELTDVLFVNKEEAQMLVGKSASLETLHTKLQELGPKLTVITDGANGSSASDGVKMEKVGIIESKKKILDKTGAGDAYAAGFITALHHHKSMKEAMLWGARNSSSVIREIGAVKGLLNLSAIQTKN